MKRQRHMKHYGCAAVLLLLLLLLCWCAAAASSRRIGGPGGKGDGRAGSRAPMMCAGEGNSAGKSVEWQQPGQAHSKKHAPHSRYPRLPPNFLSKFLRPEALGDFDARLCCACGNGYLGLEG